MSDLSLYTPDGTTELETENRTIDVITDEILNLKKTAGQAILDIGRRLIEAKEMLPHGEWLPWLNERVEYSERVAQKFMRLAREWSNPNALSDLGATKALALLALPASEREEFLAQSHMVDGQEKDVADMSARELERAIRERDIAKRTAEIAQADLRTAEDSRKKLSSDLELANEILARSQEEKAQADKTVAELKSELVRLRSAPLEVAVMDPDPEAIEKATAELRTKLNEVIAAKEKADMMYKASESAVENLKLQLEEAVMAKNAATTLSDSDVAKFGVYFEDLQETLNKMDGLIMKIQTRGDQVTAEKLSRARLKLLTSRIGRESE